MRPPHREPPPIRPARDVAEMLRAPVGRYLVGRSFLVWVQSPRLAGSMYFGRPDEREVPALLELAALPLQPDLAPPFDVLIDAGQLSGMGIEAFGVLIGHLDWVPALARRVRRVAAVRPHGMDGATIAGLFYERVLPHFQAALFTDAAEGFEWLGYPPGCAERAAVARMIAEAVQIPESLRALRAWLEDNLRDPSLEAAARRLGLAGRSLQRLLRAAGTSFRREIDRARVRAAESLLIEGDAKVETIARQIGCSSASHAAALFRRVTGETPGDFRARRRRRAAG